MECYECGCDSKHAVYDKYGRIRFVQCIMCHVLKSQTKKLKEGFWFGTIDKMEKISL